MKSPTSRIRPRPPILAIAFLSGLAVTAHIAIAQNPDIQQRLAEIKGAAAQNKQNLATYTWQEKDTISVKGEVKKQESYQVKMGADGKPQKTPLNPAAAAPPPAAPAATGRRGGRLKEKIVENKKEEFADYAKKIGALAQSYAPPDPAKLQQAHQQGNIKLNPGATPDQVQLVISSYNKPNDSMTITFDKAAKAIQSIQIASYLDTPSDVVKIGVQFAKLTDGTNHISTMSVEGVSKQLKVDIANSGYTKM
jgi:hypothetical protein